MKKMLTLSLALCAGLLFGWEADMQNKKLQTGKNIVVLNEKNQWLLGLGSSNEQDTVLLKPELSNGEFILDTTEYFKKNVNGYISLNPDRGFRKGPGRRKSLREKGSRRHHRLPRTSRNSVLLADCGRHDFRQAAQNRNPA